jgi:para-aminobenzoate synthetase/4-amino-4-deoxychorismate lyase
VLRRAAGSDRVVALTGEWASGGAIVAFDPLFVLPEDADPKLAMGTQPQVAAADDVVGGGWFGWLSFDGPSRLAFYDHLLRYRDGQWWFEALWSDERDALLEAGTEEAAALLDGPDVTAGWSAGVFGEMSMAAHLESVERAVEWIRAGEIYQANICGRLRADFGGSALGLFADASQALKPRFGAYVDGGDRSLACLSPELFLRRHGREGREVRTAPIKGTWPRTDDRGATALRHSAKDAAENVMIVDLMRNDLGRVCEIGTVRASSLLDIEPHPGVWHLVSTVLGRLREGIDDGALLEATFPPGSVTGAPKLRALDAITELEAGPRGAYTGAVGFASPSWGLELAVAIRTFEVRGERIELGVGGGVTADSVPMLEWHECLHKAAPLLGALNAELAPEVVTPVVSPDEAQLGGGLLETVLVVDGMPVRLADHLARLDRSCRELYGAGIAPDVAQRARAMASSAGPGRAVLRLVTTPARTVTMTCRAACDRPASSLARVHQRPPGLWRHKWADRRYLAAIEADGSSTPLFVAADGTVLETSRGNVFLLREDGSLVTPPLRDDVLPGVTRRALLDLARDSGRATSLRSFTLAEMRRNAAFWTSSLSGAVPIHAVDQTELPWRDEQIAELARELIPLADRRFVR